MEFVVSLDGLQRFIDSAQQDACDVFVDVDPAEGGLRLIFVHLWEARLFGASCMPQTRGASTTASAGTRLKS